MKSSSERFVKLANKRVNNAINHIRLISNLSNKSNYDYTKKQMQQIFRTLEEEVECCKARFDMKFKKDNPDFKLED